MGDQSTIKVVVKAAIYAAATSSVLSVLYVVFVSLAIGGDPSLSAERQGAILYFISLGSAIASFLGGFFYTLVLSPIGIAAYKRVSPNSEKARTQCMMIGAGLGFGVFFFRRAIELAAALPLPPGDIIKLLLVAMIYIFAGVAAGFGFWRNKQPLEVRESIGSVST